MSLVPKPHNRKPGRYLVLNLIIALIFSQFIGIAQNISKVEYYFDTDPGFGLGVDVPLTASPDITDLNFNVDISSLSQGFHTLFARAKDATGVWSATHNKPFYKYVANALPTDITRIEYFFDTDPGFGNGTSIPITPGTHINNLNHTISIGSLSNGFHTLTVRAKNEDGTWSTAHGTSFYKETYVPVTPDVAAIEYFFDNDPGFGQGTPIPVTVGENVEINDYFISLNGISNGFHIITVRTKDSFGRWSTAITRSFYKETYVPVLPDMVKLEYYFDTDPGYGNGISVPMTVGPNVEVTDFTIDLTTLPDGFHQVFVRAQDANGRWSLTSGRAFFKEFYNPVLPDMVKMEYFFDTDPGYGNGINIPIPQGPQLNNIVYNIPIFALANGFHTLYARGKDANGVWSLTHTQPFFKEAFVPVLPDIVKMEYFFDADPGNGNGIDVPVSGDTTFSEQSLLIDISAMTEGFHKIQVRAKDSKGKWSLTHYLPFYKQIMHDTLPDLVKVEYFYDTDPGLGNGINVPVSPTQNIGFLAFALDLTNVAFGEHQLNVRTKDEYGKWSLVTQDTIFYYLSTLPTASLAGPQGTCIYAPAEFTVTLTGSGPWTLIYNTGEEIDTVSNINTPFYTFQVTPQTSGPHTAQVLKVSDSEYTGLYTGIPIEYDVYPLPAQAGAITGSVNVCRGAQQVAFYIPYIANALDYVWTVPAGCTYTQYNNYWWYYGSVIYVNFPEGAQSGNISVHGVNNCGINTSSSFFVNVRENPVVNAGNDVNIGYGEDTTLLAVVSSGTAPYTYSWSPWYYTNNSGIANPLVTPPSTTTFAVYVTDFYGCTDNDEIVVTVGPPAGTTLTGTMTYDNAVHSVLNASSVYLKQGNTLIAETTTDASGNYSFSGIPAGYYTLTGSSTKTWGGVNATDAMQALKHFAQVSFLNGLAITAANVNADGSINAIDALLIAQRFVGNISSFVIGDWVSESHYLYLDGVNPQSQNLKLLCNGDIDRSYFPPAKLEPQVVLTTGSEMLVEVGTVVALPLTLKADYILGAASLVLNIPEGVEILSVTPSREAMGEVLWNAENNQLRLAWYSLQGIDFKANDILFLINVRIQDLNNTNFSIGEESVFATPEGSAVANAVIGLPKLQTAANSTVGLSLSNEPNPFRLQTNLSYQLPFDGDVRIQLVNSLGELVMVQSAGSQKSGNQRYVLQTGDLPAGIYHCNLSINGTNGEHSQTIKMIIGQ